MTVVVNASRAARSWCARTSASTFGLPGPSCLPRLAGADDL